MSRNHLILFVKEPRLGAVKRRLARDIGPVAALSFYRATLGTLLRRLGSDRRWRLVVAVAPAPPPPPPRAPPPPPPRQSRHDRR